jgi:hypothetical protein
MSTFCPGLLIDTRRPNMAIGSLPDAQDGPDGRVHL